MEHRITQIVLDLLDKQMRKPRETKGNTVFLSPVLLWVGIVCTALFLIPGLILPLFTGSWESWPFLGFAALSASLILGYRNCRIWYNEEGFTARYLLGYSRHFTYDQIESIQGWNRDVKLKVRGCTVRVDELAVGKREFLGYAKKRYRTLSGGKPIPVVEKSKWDPFNGHVDNPGEIAAAYILIAVILPAFVLGAFFTTEPTPMEELTFFTSAVVYENEEERDLLLFRDETVTEVWGYRRTITDPQAFLLLCGKGESFTIGYRTVTDDGGNTTGLSVEYIEDSSGRVWMTPKDAFGYRFYSVLWVILGFELLWLSYCGASVHIGRNPQKFSKKVIRMFFKDGYVH